MRTISFDDALTIKSGILVHGCNAQGVMGAGFAKQLKTLYPGAYCEYIAQVNAIGIGSVNTLGTVSMWHSQESDLTIANAITQLNYGRDQKLYTSYEAVHRCFVKVADVASFLGKSVHYPLIGAGLGGGDWAIISDIISSLLDPPGIQHVLHLKQE